MDEWSSLNWLALAFPDVSCTWFKWSTLTFNQHAWDMRVDLRDHKVSLLRTDRKFATIYFEMRV